MFQEKDFECAQIKSIGMTFYCLVQIDLFVNLSFLQILSQFTIKSSIMENTEQEKKTSFAGSAITYGILTGIGLIVLTLLAYLFDISETNWLSLLGFAVLLAGIILGTLQYRNDGAGGFISYGRALGYGTLISVFTALISSVFIYVFYLYIAPDAHQLIKDAYYDNLIQSNAELNDEQIDKFVNIITSPLLLSIFNFLSYGFIGFIFSLATSAFIKKNDPEEAF